MKELPMRRSRTGLLLTVLIYAIAVTGQQSANSGGAPADIVYARPGQLVDVGGFRLNLYCMGSGSPTVVFDSGWGDWAPAWSKVQPQVAKWTRACSYDRAGTGFSDPGPMPRTSVRIAKELRTALHRASIGGPYILVGSAFGGDNVRTFAYLYMAEVAGLVLDDADSDDVGPKAMQEESHRGQARIPKQMRECRDTIVAHKPLPAACPQRFFRGLPEAEWSPELNAKLLEIAQTKVAMYDAYASEMEQTPADEIYLQQHHRSFGSRPIRVLTSGNHAVGHLERKPPDTPEHLKYEQETTAAQARWLSLSSNSKQIFARNSSEYIQFDEPETVINAIREVYDQSEKPVVAGGPTSQGAPGTVFGDCRECPEMVVLPAGSFTMGSSAEEKSWAASHGSSMGSVADEAPQHQVSLPSFALGRYDITRGEYAAFARETGYPAGDGCGRGHAIFKWEKDPKVTWDNPGYAQTDRDPVVCVSWHDARAYIAWLNRKAHRGTASANGPYRLPSEAEWEYAARGGTTTKFYWGDDDAAAPVHAWFNANSGCKKVEGLFCDGGQTHPVGAKPPNAFGLYDIAGNVWQWTEDCYDNSYAGIPANGRANEAPSNDPQAKDGQGNCLRVDRGGSWMFPAWLLRPATRERNPANYRNDIMGFRVARTLP
jgi:formylglycine-generating enzyme required for sulfatase activity